MKNLSKLLVTDQITDGVAKIAYRVSEAVVASGLSRSLLYENMKNGTLRSKKCGRRTLILHDDLVDFLKRLP
jgi:hypothetical protein